MKTKLDELRELSEAMLREIARLEKLEQEPKKFEFKYEEEKLVLYDVCIAYNTSVVENHKIKYGRYRKTKESAEDALELNKRANRLHATVEMIQGDNNGDYYVAIPPHKTEYNVIARKDYNPCQVYMEKETAIEICRLLNSGQLEL